MGYWIRPATLPSDRGAMLDVLETVNMHRVPSPEMDDFDVGQWYVAESEGRVVGVAGFRLVGPGNEPVGKTTLLAVTPDQRIRASAGRSRSCACG